MSIEIRGPMWKSTIASDWYECHVIQEDGSTIKVQHENESAVMDLALDWRKLLEERNLQAKMALANAGR